MKSREQVKIDIEAVFIAPLHAQVECPVCGTPFTKNRKAHVFHHPRCKENFYYRDNGDVSGLLQTIAKVRKVADAVAETYMRRLHVNDYDFLIDVSDTYASAKQMIESESKRSLFSAILDEVGMTQSNPLR